MQSSPQIICLTITTVAGFLSSFSFLHVCISFIPSCIPSSPAENPILPSQSSSYSTVWVWIPYQISLWLLFAWTQVGGCLLAHRQLACGYTTEETDIPNHSNRQLSISPEGGRDPPLPMIKYRQAQSCTGLISVMAATVSSWAQCPCHIQKTFLYSTPPPSLLWCSLIGGKVDVCLT